MIQLLIIALLIVIVMIYLKENSCLQKHIREMRHVNEKQSARLYRIRTVAHVYDNKEDAVEKIKEIASE